VYTPKYVSILEQRREGLRRDLDRILPNSGTFLLEVGCGHGHFLTAYAAAHPQRTCIGIDLIGERIERAEKKRTRAKLENLHFLQAEARLFLEVIPPAAKVDAVFVLFPDPWPKARHNKHRIIQPAFLENLARHVVPDCPLYFRTDFTPYYAAAREVLSQAAHWQLSDEPWPFEYVTVFQQRAEAFHSLIARCKTPRG
jgi:tRNA (guanine-N7-)-methyltransferase